MDPFVQTAAVEIDSLERRLQSNPLSPLFARLARLYLEADRLDDACDLSEKGVAHYPEYATGHLILGQCYVRLGRFCEATEELRKTLYLQPQCGVARSLLEKAILQLPPQRARETSVATEPSREPQVEVSDLEAKSSPAPESEARGLEEPVITKGSEDEIVTSTLAEIYAAQGAYREAIRTYVLLACRNPEERGEFEKRIRELEEKWRTLSPPS